MATFTTGLDARVALRIEAVETATNVTTNTSTIYVELWLDRISGTGRWSTNVTPNWGVSAGAQSDSGSGGYDVRGGSQRKLARYFANVPHNADGTGSVAISGYFNDPTGNVASGSTGGTLTLSTIPRATSPTVTPSSGQTAATFTINHVPATSTFSHDIAYSVDGGATYTDIAVGVPGTDTSTDWTPPHSLLPNVALATAIIRAITKSGATVIGTRTVNLPLSVPASVRPTISAVAWEDVQVTSPDLPTLMGGAGRFVQRWSKLKPTVTAAGAGGSSVVVSKVTQNGQTTDSGVAFGLPINLSGNVPYSAVATDSRTRDSDPYANTVAVKAYNFPNLPVPLVTRTSDSGGTTPSPIGTFLAITPAASVSALNFGDGEKNLLEWRVRTRPSGGSWTTVQDWTNATVSGNTWTTKYVTLGTYLASQAYEVEVSIRDLFGKGGFDTANTVKTLAIPVASEFVFMDWNGQDQLGLFMYAQYDGLNVGKPIYQEGLPVVDFGDVATTTTPGISELATNAEAVSGTDTTRTVTPAGVAAAIAALTATTTRRGIIEIATVAETIAGTDTERAVTPQGLVEAIRSGRQGRIPSSVVIGSGSASVAADGTISFTGVSRISLNDVFDGAGMDCYEIIGSFGQSAVSYVATRMRAAGVDDTSSSYVYTATLTSLSAGPTRSSSAGANIFGFWNTSTPAVASPTIRGNLRVTSPAVAGQSTTIEMSSFVAAGDRFVWHESSNAPGTGVYDGLTILAGSGTLTGFLKVVKIA